MHLCTAIGPCGFLPVGGMWNPCLASWARSSLRNTRLSLANQGRRCPQGFHRVKLPSVGIHEWPTVVTQLVYHREEFCTVHHGEPTGGSLSVVGIGIHEMEQRMTHAGIGAHS